MTNRRALMTGLACAAVAGAALKSRAAVAEPQGPPPDAEFLAALRANVRPLRGPGRDLLVAEARAHHVFMLGELHGDNEIPALLADLWPTLWGDGYRHVAAEISPWTAARLNNGETTYPGKLVNTWTQGQAAIFRRLVPDGEAVIWGCDIEELRPDLLIGEIAGLNPSNAALQQMAKIVAEGYRRTQAKDLLRLARDAGEVRDRTIGGLSEWSNLLDTLNVEALRSDPALRWAASDAREKVMKTLLLAHLAQAPHGKVLLRFGRNHLYRGYDARGVSTLGNFAAEWALAQGRSAMNLGVFAAGGQERLLGKTFDADERSGELTFAAVADLATEPAIVDLRPLRPALNRIEPSRRSPFQSNLTYWANGYDLLLCYPAATPLLD